MQAAWTDEGLDDLAYGMRHGFAQSDQHIRVDDQDIRGDLHSSREELSETFAKFRRNIYWIGGGIFAEEVIIIALILWY